jgi:hypothetical protein
LVRALGRICQSGDEVATEAKGAFGGASRPDWPEIDANGRKNWDMENCQEALRELFRLFKLESNSAEPEIKDPGTPAALVTDNSVGVGASQGHTFGFALNGERGICDGCASLF